MMKKLVFTSDFVLNGKQYFIGECKSFHSDEDASDWMSKSFLPSDFITNIVETAGAVVVDTSEQDLQILRAMDNLKVDVEEYNKEFMQGYISANQCCQKIMLASLNAMNTIDHAEAVMLCKEDDAQKKVKEVLNKRRITPNDQAQA
jgi:hypothetical protein